MDGFGDYESSGAYNDLEKRVLRYTEELVRRQSTDEQLLDELKRDLDERELVELNLTIGFTIMINLFVKSFRVL